MRIGIVYYSRSGNTREIAEILCRKLRERNADVTRIIIIIVKVIKNKKPAGPNDLRAISAIELPFSLIDANKEVKSWTAPKNIAPRTTHNQAGPIP